MKVFARKRRRSTISELGKIRDESGYISSRGIAAISGSDWKIINSLDWEEAETATPEQEVESRIKEARQTASDNLAQHLRKCCLDPSVNLLATPWYYDDLFGAAVRARLADTIVTSRINETLDFWFAHRRMVLIEGVAGCPWHISGA